VKVHRRVSSERLFVLVQAGMRCVRRAARAILLAVGASVVISSSSAATLPPVFATLSGIQLTNTATNGNGAITLSLNPPVFASAGNYQISVRAAALDGSSGTIIIQVNVNANPALTSTRWKDPVAGSWNDPARWSAGLPDSSKAAIIDVPGDYTVRLDSDVTVAGVLLGGTGSKARVTVNGRTLTLDANGLNALGEAADE